MKTRVLFYSLYFVILSGTWSPVLAFHFTTPPPTITLDCSGVNVITDATGVADRDNTGSNTEQLQITGTDGAGNIILSGTIPIPIGANFFFVGGVTISWVSPPQFNPLTLNIISVAGNSFAAETVISVTGTCAGLPSVNAIPTMTEWGMIIFMVFAALASVYHLRRQKKAGS